jgi:uncharacterized alkaline shock family protein YloU
MSAKEEKKAKDAVTVSAPPYTPGPEERTEEDGDLGSVQIHNGVIAVIARLAALRVEGVVDMVGNLVDGLAGIVGRKSSDRGVHVEIVDNSVVIEMSVVLEYGVSIPKTCWQIQHDVREGVESMTGKAVKAVNVLVQSVQFPAGGREEKKPDKAKSPAEGS